MKDKITGEMSGVPHSKRAAKYRSLILGVWFVLLGSVLCVLGMMLMLKVETFSPWLLVPCAGGMLVATMGGHIASREAATAALSAIGTEAAKVIRAIRGSKGS